MAEEKEGYICPLCGRKKCLDFNEAIVENIKIIKAEEGLNPEEKEKIIKQLKELI